MALRNLLAVPLVRELAASASVRILAEMVIGKNCFAVKGTFFNKTQESNWKVAWHQDLTIMVRERREVAGFGPWTIKEGIAHVQPTADILNRILAIRLHLDEKWASPSDPNMIGFHRNRSLLTEGQTASSAWFLGAALCSCARCCFTLRPPVLFPSRGE